MAKSEAAELLEIRLKYLFDGVDLEKRIITFSEDISEGSFLFFDACLNELEKTNTRGIKLRINSYGGSVYEALAIVGRLRASKCRLTTEGYGCIMSAATLLLAAGDKRRISELAWFMHHESSYSLEGKHSEITHTVKQQEREDDQWAEWMEEFSKKDKKFWKETGSQLDAYFSAEELLEMGVVDEVF